ncbi:MAG: hypothetical protein H0W30_01030 [Gemmatimonadaceae bacterium]|nr:hypothetical protein [Gemmatimonadaceae bacterium]MBA3557158.1 hypothetical protein [Gemmatimonadaceae bacterium]
MKTPAETVKAAFDALNIEDWAGLMAACDPVSLRAFKRETVEDLSEEKHYDITVDDLREIDPDMPREVAKISGTGGESAYQYRVSFTA